MIKWMVFYDDGSVFSNEDGEPWKAPATGVQVVLQIDADGKWVFYQKYDHYCWGWRSSNEWVPCDAKGEEDYRWHHDGPQKVLYGRWTSNKNFDEIYKKADKAWREIGNG